jgi:hypothetical protein
VPTPEPITEMPVSAPDSSSNGTSEPDTSGSSF